MSIESSMGLGRQLGILEGAGLIALAATDPELEYLFRHVLIQDAAYASLLRQERRELHAHVAEALLQLYPSRRDDLAPVLAHHYERAEDRSRTIEYLTLAAQRARARFAGHEAVDFARRALEFLPDDRAVDAETRRLRIELRFIITEAGADFIPLGEHMEVLGRVIEDAEALGDVAAQARAHLFVALARSAGGDQYHRSGELARALERSTELAEASGSQELVGQAIAVTANARLAAAEFPEGIELMERAIPMLVESGLLYQASMAAGQLSVGYGHVGDFERAVAWADRAYALGEESGDPNATLGADLGRGIVEGLRGDPAAAIDYAGRAARVAERVDNKSCAMVAHSVIGEERMKLGDPEQAAIAFEASADLAEYCQFMPVKIEQTQILLQAARARAGVGRVEFARYERAFELARHIGDRLAEAQLYQQRGADRIRAGRAADATADLARAEELFAEIGAMPLLEQVRAQRAAMAGTEPRGASA